MRIKSRSKNHGQPYLAINGARIWINIVRLHSACDLLEKKLI